MPDIHELLNDCQVKSQELVDEISAFKESRVLHQKATDALESTAKALQVALEDVKPLAEMQLNRLRIIIVGALALNSLFFLILLVVAIFRGGN